VDRRRSLLDAAIAQIAAAGTRGLRVDDVAARAGVSTALIYHHFGDRSTLLREALTHVGDRAEAYTAAASGTGRQRVITVALAEIQDDPTVRMNSSAWGELRGAAIFDDSLQPALVAQLERWHNDLTELITLGWADGSICRADQSAEATAAAVTAVIEGFSGRWLSGVLDTGEARTALAAACNALLGDPPPRRLQPSDPTTRSS
jgi:AcrR family transcriptional regulator